MTSSVQLTWDFVVRDREERGSASMEVTMVLQMVRRCLSGKELRMEAGVVGELVSRAREERYMV